MQEIQKVLITGGSGLLGQRLTELLLAEKIPVIHLGRKEDLTKTIPVFGWNPTQNQINIKAFDGVSHIIHLAGAGVADQRWTQSRKQEILNSRVESTKLLYQTIAVNKLPIKAIVSASAIGYYGFQNTDSTFHENDKAGTDFLAKVTKAWEAETSKFADLGIRNNIVRIGIVLSNKGGALTQMMQPIKYYLGAPLGSGNQMMSWIHIDDLCNFMIYCLKNQNCKGIYNGVSSVPISNKNFTNILGKKMSRPILPIAVPAFMMKILLGEMANMVLGSCAVANTNIIQSGYAYKFDNLDLALDNLLH